MPQKLWIKGLLKVVSIFSLSVIHQCDPSFVQFKRISSRIAFTAVIVEIRKYDIVCRLCYNTLLVKPPL